MAEQGKLCSRAEGQEDRRTEARAQETGCYRVSSHNLEFLLYSGPLIFKKPNKKEFIVLVSNAYDRLHGEDLILGAER